MNARAFLRVLLGACTVAILAAGTAFTSAAEAAASLLDTIIFTVAIDDGGGAITAGIGAITTISTVVIDDGGGVTIAAIAEEHPEKGVWSLKPI